METTSTGSVPQQDNTQEGLLLNEAGRNYLEEAAMWAKTLSIIFYVTAGFIILAGIIMAVSLRNLSMDGAVFGVIMLMVYVLIAMLYLFWGKYLRNFSTKSNSAVRTGKGYELTEGIASLKSFFKLFAIITIIGLVFSLFAVIMIVLVEGF
jgi:hypothetical protein